MARIRTIKPGFFTNDLLAEIPPIGRILFAGLWCIADREGRIFDRPAKIKVEILPYDECDVDELLSMLEERKFITRYREDDVACIQINNWTKHQHPHPRETDSEIPAMKSGTRKARPRHGLGNAKALSSRAGSSGSSGPSGPSGSSASSPTPPPTKTRRPPAKAEPPAEPQPKTENRGGGGYSKQTLDQVRAECIEALGEPDYETAYAWAESRAAKIPELYVQGAIKLGRDHRGRYPWQRARPKKSITDDWPRVTTDPRQPP